MRPLVMLDLFAGHGGASRAMRDRGWRVVTVDSDPRHYPDVVADVRALPLRVMPLDLLWASPPCTRYSWARPGVRPAPTLLDQELWHAVLELVEAWHPRYWVIENVKGADLTWGPPAAVVRSHYLWGVFPFPPGAWHRKRAKVLVRPPAHRARIPYELSVQLAYAVERMTTGRRD